MVLQKMLTIQGPDSFKWANSKGMITLLLSIDFSIVLPPRHDSPAHGSEGEKHRLGPISARGKCGPKPKDEERRVDPVAHRGDQEANHQVYSVENCYQM